MSSVDVFCRTLLQALAENVLHGLVLVLAVSLLLRLFSRTSAALRSTLWALTLGSVLLLLAVGVGGAFLETLSKGPALGQGNEEVTAGSTEAAAKPLVLPGRWVPAAEYAAAPAAPERRPVSGTLFTLPFSQPLPLLLILALATAAALGTVRLAWSFLYLKQLKTRSQPPSERELASLARCQRLIGERRKVRLRVSPDISSPLLAGLQDPVILLPAALDTLQDAEIDYVVLHELAHLRRRDDWTNLVQTLAESWFCFHPAVCWIGRQLRLERELHCDDWVVSLLGEARPYAACLTKMARIRQSTQGFALATGATLHKPEITRRIEVMLNPTHDPNPRLPRRSLPMLALALGVLLLPLLFAPPLISLPSDPADDAELDSHLEALLEQVEQGMDHDELTDFVRGPVSGIEPEAARLEFLLELGPPALRDPNLHADYFEAALSLSEDRLLHELFASLLHQSWLGRDAREEMLTAARRGFRSEENLVAFLNEQAEYFLGEESLRRILRDIARDLGSESLYPWVDSGEETRWHRSPGTAAPRSEQASLSLNISPSTPATAATTAVEGDIDELTRALASTDADERATAVFQLGQMRATSAVAPLIELLGDETPVSRGATSQWWGGADESRSHTSPGEEAGKALLYLGLEAREGLAEAANRDDWAGRDRATRVLGLLANFD